MKIFQRLAQKLFTPVDIAPLVFFRVAFGGLMLWEVWRYFYYNRVERYYIEPSFFFHYYGFEWIKPLPGDGMIWLFYGMGLLAAAVMVGFYYRLSSALFWVGFTYIFLLDQTQYLNHFYLISLLSFWMIFVPAGRYFSFDAWRKRALHRAVMPLWVLWVLRGQMAVVYVYGGIAKINPDWLRGEPMRAWLAARTDFPVIGRWFTEEWMVYLFSYGGLLFDLLIVPLLLWRRTRLPALLLSSAFHLTNDRLFNIGIFPWLALAATLLFLPPHWFRLRFAPAPPALPTLWQGSVRQKTLAGLIGVFFAMQLLLPLRHFLYPGYVSWTEEGHNFAWHMKLRDKDGEALFFASDPHTGMTWQVSLKPYLTTRQIDQMHDNPQMILRFARYLAAQVAAEGTADAQIRVWAMISLNNRAPQLLIDPTANLAIEPDTLLPAHWILPLLQDPSPLPAKPALLISRRDKGALVLLNITETAFPLAALRLQAGDETLSGLDFGLNELAPNACVIAHGVQADLRHVFPICNEAGTRQVLNETAWDSVFSVWFAGQEAHICAQPVCLVS